LNITTLIQGKNLPPFKVAILNTKMLNFTSFYVVIVLLLPEADTGFLFGGGQVKKNLAQVFIVLGTLKKELFFIVIFKNLNY